VEKHGWKIRDEEYVRPDQGKTPPHAVAKATLDAANPILKSGDVEMFLASPPKFVDQFHHGHIKPFSETK